MMKKPLNALLLFLLIGSILSGCGQQAAPNIETELELQAETNLEQINMAQWSYNAEDDVYWQVGISYCETPANKDYETMGIFVPGAYMSATDNGDGTYTCAVNKDAELSGYTALTAPMVIPIETPGYAAMSAPADYSSSVKQYTDAGFIYLYAGARGRNEGAPAGVTDFKAAIRYTRYNAGVIPGDTDRIFSFGMSGGGAQSALLGATGDSELYTPYLEAIGAVSNVSDAVAGAMCWCPITNLDTANEAYEWNMGVTRTGLDSFTQQLSNDMAAAFAEYINDIELHDGEGNILVLAESKEGIYQSGSYYDYMKAVIEESLNSFLASTEFPYTPSAANAGISAGDRGNGGMGNGNFPMENMSEEEKAAMQERFGENGNQGGMRGPMGGRMPANQNAQYEADDINRNDATQSAVDTSTYENAEEYIASLNETVEWVSYDPASNTATITNIADFVSHCKAANKNIAAFDDLDATQGENTLFGYGDGQGAHFDSIMADLLASSDYGSAYASDLRKTDALGNTVDYRMNMYNPMYYLDDYYAGYESSTVAKYWRIRTGINQADTALTTEVNLALALESYGDLDVDFETVWGYGHTKAESSGDSDGNFIAWVNSCLQ